MTDIHTQWTENQAVPNRSQHAVAGRIAETEAEVPFPILGFDTDNGGEFLNWHLVDYFRIRPWCLFSLSQHGFLLIESLFWNNSLFHSNDPILEFVHLPSHRWRRNNHHRIRTMKTNIIPTPLPRISRFEELGYGLFIHWGLYSQLEHGEWIQSHRKIPAEEYRKMINHFTAADFDARHLAKLARASGFKYASMGTRHHEGFSLYDTRGLSDFDSMHAPSGRDLVREFVDACREEGIVPYLYHTLLDWERNSAECSDAEFDAYLDYLHGSVEILCTHYGELGGLWFDGTWSRETDWKEDRLYALIRRLQPEAIIINNTGLGALGQSGHPELDSVTFEQGLPTAPDRRGWPKYLAGEMCETLNSHWGIGKLDFNYKSVGEIIRHLCACRKTGSNYLLNIGPTATGGIPYYEEALLRKVGEWIALHGDLLYLGRPVAVNCQANDFVLTHAGKYYYFAHDLHRRGDTHVVAGSTQTGPRAIDGFPAAISEVVWMDEGEVGRFVQSEDNKLLTLDCAGFDYGNDLVVRVAEMRP